MLWRRAREGGCREEQGQEGGEGALQLPGGVHTPCPGKGAEAEGSERSTGPRECERAGQRAAGSQSWPDLMAT